MTWDYDRARAFGRMAPLLARSGRVAEAERLLLDGLAVVPTSFLDTRARLDLLGELIRSASEAVLVEPALHAAAELEKHERVATPDMWDPAGQIMAHDRRQEADRAVTARTGALQALGAALTGLARFEDAERVTSALRDPGLQAATRRDGALALATGDGAVVGLDALPPWLVCVGDDRQAQCAGSRRGERETLFATVRGRTRGAAPPARRRCDRAR